MTIAELFVNLGITGTEKTVGALSNVKKGMGDLSSTSLEAKAAIVGAMYALQRLMSNSAQMGTGLSNFNALTGLSTKSLQQWQYAARQAGVSSEELTGSVKSVQQSMTNMLLGKGAPEGMGMLANKVGFDEKRARDTFYVMQKLQEFAKSQPADVGNNVLKSFGLSEGTIAAMRKNVFNPKTLAQAPVYSEGQIGQLNKVDVAWKNLSAKIEMAMGKFSSKHGLDIVKDISKLTDQVFKLIEAFSRLADKLKLFEGIGKVFEGWSMLFGGLSGAVDTVAKDKKGTLHGLAEQGEGFAEGLGQFLKGAFMTATEGLDMKDNSEISEKTIAPKMPNTPPPTKSQNVNINQNLNFQHEGKDHQKTSDSVKKAIRGAVRQMSSQGQAT